MQGVNYQAFVTTWSVLEKGLPIFKEADLQIKEKVTIAVRSEHIESTVFHAFIEYNRRATPFWTDIGFFAKTALSRYLGPCQTGPGLSE
jgi:hypothetical protein